MTKYPEKFDKISLIFSIFIDLIISSNYNILSNEKIKDFIFGISKNFIKDLEEYKKTTYEQVKEKLKENKVKYLNPYNINIFIENIKIGNDIFKKEELNSILHILFFIKEKGNITAHPNIDLNKSLKMGNTSNIPLKFEIDHFYGFSLKEKFVKEINKNTEVIYEDNFHDMDYLDGLMDDILQKITNIRNDIFSRLKIYKIKKDVHTINIIETIFEGKDNQINEGLNGFKKVFLSTKDNVIKKI